MLASFVTSQDWVDWAHFRSACARSHPNSAGTTRTLHALGSQLQTVEQRRDTAASKGSRWSPMGFRAARDPPGREHQLSECTAEFISPPHNGNVLRERCRTLRCLRIGCRGEGVRKRRRDCGAEDAAVTGTRAAPRLRSLGRRDGLTRRRVGSFSDI